MMFDIRTSPSLESAPRVSPFAFAVPVAFVSDMLCFLLWLYESFSKSGFYSHMRKVRLVFES